ncbi:uncharacterized protein LOC109121636 [Vitis vinifera]|uniref:uncharacterized protein LOC109121636 n=1 Tax=Vitis vinifera TaxID=29760 RepID=UPI0008FEB135|nr:uncharacterized protein LOC109121636 [Vitis vinifera]|eukprot:XP_019071916.1 PREDICTED: uncharacterized protein LOC109121636 [Vitis vinifera]
MVSERGIEVDPDKIKVILDMLVPRTEKEIREFDIHYVSQKSIKGSIVADHLASLPTSEGRPVDDDFPDKEFIAMTSLSDRHPATNNIVECEACILGLEIALELGIRQMEVGRFDDLRYTCLPKAQNQFVDALTTLASSVDISTNVVIRPLLIESRFAPAYCCLIGETEAQDDLSWYYDIYQLLRSRTYPEATTAKDRRALRQLATRFMICGETLYRRSANVAEAGIPASGCILLYIGGAFIPANCLESKLLEKELARYGEATPAIFGLAVEPPVGELLPKD